jgi:ferredoxin
MTARRHAGAAARGTAATPSGAALAVDRIRCDGSGMCAEILPEVVALDDWGYPMLAAGSVPESLLPLARRAVERCPVLALRLVPAATSRQAGPGHRARPVFTRA